MADKDPGKGPEEEGPSLELPSFGWRRRKSRKRTPAAPDAPAADEPTPAEEPTAEGPTPDEPTADEEPTREVPRYDETPAAEPEPPAEPVREPEPTAEPAPEPAVARESAAATTSRRGPRLPSLPRRKPAREPVPAAAPPRSGTDPQPTTAPATEDETQSGAVWEGLQLPDLPGRVAAAVVGVVIGLLAVLATFGAMRLCSLVRGTSSCGGPGLLLLIAILVVLILLGGWLLKGFGQPDPMSTSFLAVGLVAVVALLFLIDVLFSWTMVIVIPLVGAGTYVLSHWVTTNVIEPARDDPPA